MTDDRNTERPEDWDDEGAQAISLEACRMAIHFVRDLRRRLPDAPLPKPAPSVLGAVSLYWRRGDRHLIVRVWGNDRRSVFYQLEGPGNQRTRSTEDYTTVLKQALQFLTS